MPNEANGSYDPGKATEEIQDMVGDTPRRSRGTSDKRNHLSLVQGHMLQLGHIPRSCWEPVSALLTEYYKFRHVGLTEEEIKEGVEHFAYQKDWINILFGTSQSVDGKQAELMVRGMGADKAWEAKHPAAQVTGNGATGQPEAKESRRWLPGRG